MTEETIHVLSDSSLAADCLFLLFTNFTKLLNLLLFKFHDKHRSLKLSPVLASIRVYRELNVSRVKCLIR